MEIQVFRNENSSQTNAYSHYSNYSYSGLMSNERALKMTRGGGMKILRGGSENFKTPERGALKKIRGGSKNLYTSKPTGGVGGLLKFQASSFNIFIPPLSY